jgi:hypothetical protein
MRALRNLVLPAAFAIVASAGFASQAAAHCEVTGDIFYLHKNDVSKHTAKTDVQGCDLHFITAGKIRFRRAKIVTAPQNGNLRKIAHLEFRYRPKPGFKGTDTFALQLCGRTPKGSGCSILNYEATVE